MNKANTNDLSGEREGKKRNKFEQYTQVIRKKKKKKKKIIGVNHDMPPHDTSMDKC